MAKEKIFLSWSGDISLRLARAFEKWLEKEFEVDAFCSYSDIVPGEIWNNTVHRNLKSSKLGLLFIVRENLNAPWLLFEAGAMLSNDPSGANSDFIPILFDLAPNELVGPLSHYHSLAFSKKNILKILTRIFSNSGTYLDNRKALNEKVNNLWPNFEKKVQQILSQTEFDEAFRKLTPENQILNFLESIAKQRILTFYKPRDREYYLSDILVRIIESILTSSNIDLTNNILRQTFKDNFIDMIGEWLASNNFNLVFFASEIIGYFKIDTERFKTQLNNIFKKLDIDVTWENYQLNCLWAYSRLTNYDQMNDMLSITKNGYNQAWILEAYEQMILNKDNEHGDDLSLFTKTIELLNTR